MKKIMTLVLMTTLLSPLSAIELPNFGIDPEMYYEGYLVIEAIEVVREIAEEEIELAVDQTAQEFRIELEHQNQTIADQQVTLNLYKNVSIGLGVTVVVLALIQVIQ